MRTLACLSALGLAAVLLPQPLAAQISAHLSLEAYDGSVTCTECHEQAAHQVMATTHWTWEHTNALTGQVLGKNNVINNYCIAVPSNEPRCTSCHVGWGYTDKNFDFSNANNVDCLVCHDTTGEYRKFPTAAGLPNLDTPKEFPAGSGTIWPVVDLAKIAQNVGKTSRATCGACHFFGGGADAVKHGDIDSTLYNPSREVDVHMGINGGNFSCTECHVTRQHQIPGTRYAKDHTDAKMCESCHSTAPHAQRNPMLDTHAAKVACQTCHIPAYARGNKATKMSWDWSTAGQKDANGKNQIIKDASGEVIYDTQKGTFVWARNVVPEYVWFNGLSTYVTLDDPIEPGQVIPINDLHGSPTDGKSKIFPVKRFRAKQPYDLGAQRLAIPNLFANNAGDTDAYWKSFNWENALRSGMAYIGESWTGPVGWVETEMYWVQNHMVAPKEQALRCADCHTSTGGRLDFAALGYPAERVTFLQSSAPYSPQVVHAGLTGYEGSQTCTKCHSAAAHEVMATTHWTWEHTNAITGQVLGKNNVINNYCIAVASNEPRCTSCHVGWGYADKNFNFADATKVDCLVCHDTTGEYRKFPAGAGLPVLDAPKEFPAGSGTIWPVVDLAKVARNVGKTSRATCGACHFFGGGADAVKHGDIDSSLYNPTREVDVHMGVNGGNFSCTQCHQTENHQIPGTRYAKNHTDAQMCESCHSTAPHAGVDPNLDRHTATVACQTCHIPAFARGDKATKMRWDWSTAGQKDANGKNQIIKNAAGEVIYDTQKGTFEWERNVVPEYVWFNGGATYVTLDDTIEPGQVVQINALHGSPTDGKSKIFPVKRFTAKQPYDAGAKHLAIPNLFPNNASDTDAYWKSFNWENSLQSGMAYAGETWVGPVGWVESEMYWVQNHMVAPKEQALRCTDCHTSSGGRLDFAALGFGDRALTLATMFERPRFLEQAQVQGGLRLRWMTIAGRSYQLLSATDLKGWTWTPVSEPMAASGAAQEYTVPSSALSGASQIFFRVQQLP